MLRIPIPLLCFLLLTNPLCAKNVNSNPSFDCSKAKSHTEKLICAPHPHYDLGKLDREINKLYSKAVKQNPRVKKTQRDWLKRSRLEKEAYKLSVAYRDRINYLKHILSSKRDFYEFQESLVYETPEGMKFSVPSQCDQIINHPYDSDKYYNQLDMNFATKFYSICEFWLLRQQGEKNPKHDYLKGLDVMQLDATLLPYQGCIGYIFETYMREICDQFFQSKSQPSFFSKVVKTKGKPLKYELRDQSPGKRISQDCRVRERVLSLVVGYGKKQIKCRMSKDRKENRQGFTIKYFAFRDVNRDGYMDLIITQEGLPIGGSMYVQNTLVLTRTNTDQPQLQHLKVKLPGEK